MRIVLVQLKSGDFLRIYDGDTTSGNLLFDETDGHEKSINSTGYVNNESFGKKFTVLIVQINLWDFECLSFIIV